jgi:hypothetical protein
MRSQLERAINLAANTGDKIIVVDELNDRSSVVMSLDEYEKLLNGQNKGRNRIKNLTEEELLDKINRDIVTWKDANSEKKFYEEMEDDNDDFEQPFAKASPFAKAMGDEMGGKNELDFDEDDDKTNSDFIAPHFDAEGNLIPDVSEEPAGAKSTFTSPNEPMAAKADEDQNMYYYHEPEKAESGFTSIKDELKKNRKTWAIPEEVKEKAEEVPF